MTIGNQWKDAAYDALREICSAARFHPKGSFQRTVQHDQVAIWIPREPGSRFGTGAFVTRLPLKSYEFLVWRGYLSSDIVGNRVRLTAVGKAFEEGSGG